MKVIKKLSVCLVLILVASLFFACSPRRQGQTSFTYDELMEKFEGEIERGATIRVLDNKMSLETGFFDEIVDAFNEKYKEYGVTAIDANIDDYTDLETAGPDGYGPDVLYQANDILMGYAEGGHLLPLPMEELKQDKTLGIDQMTPLALETYTKETYGLDLVYGIPVAQQTTVLTYRKDLLPQNWETEWDDNKNGIPDMVENMNDLYKYSQQVATESGGSKYGLYMSLVDQYFNSEYLLSYGAYVFGESSEDIGLNADGAEVGLNVFRDMAGVVGSKCISQNATTQVATYLTDSKGTVFCTIGTPDWLTTFQENLSATYVNGGMSEEEADKAAKENLVVVAPPSLPKDGNIKKEIAEMETETFEPITMGGVNAFSISAYTEYPKTSLAFVKFVAEYENIKWRSEALGAAPARVDLAEELGGVSAMISERFENEKVKVMPSTGDISYIWSPLSSLFNDVATDNTTRDKPIYTSPEALKGALNKMVEDIKSAIALGKN